MFARVSKLDEDPTRVDESLAYLEQKILPQVRQLSGANGMLAMIDRSTGQSLAITLWESEEAMRATEQAADQLRGDAADATDAEIASVERYEIVVDERF